MNLNKRLTALQKMSQNTKVIPIISERDILKAIRNVPKIQMISNTYTVEASNTSARVVAPWGSTIKFNIRLYPSTYNKESDNKQMLSLVQDSLQRNLGNFIHAIDVRLIGDELYQITITEVTQ